MIIQVDLQLAARQLAADQHHFEKEVAIFIRHPVEHHYFAQIFVAIAVTPRLAFFHGLRVAASNMTVIILSYASQH